MDAQIQPSLQEVKRLASLPDNKDKNIIPLVREVLGDLETPVSAFLKIRRGEYSFLLESVVGGENRGRYSFIGTEPFNVMTLDAADADPLVPLENAMKSFKPIELPSFGLPPLAGGAVGFVGYEAVKYFEPRVAASIDKQKNPLNIPISMWMFVDSIVMFDHVRHVVKIVTHCKLDTGDIDAAYNVATDRIRVLTSRLDKPLSKAARGLEVTIDADTVTPPLDIEGSSNVGKEGYKAFVKDLKTNIVAGNIIQAVPSQRIHQKLPSYLTSFDLYRHLRMVNPSPYMFYVECGKDTQLVGASPEMLVKVDADRRVETHPIAGTRLRGKSPAEDEALAKELLADEKERAEHIMLVDLGRNDVGRVSKPGTVKVDALMVIEKYSHVQHIVSKVSGELADDKTVYDAFRAIFPAGTVSGAPKVSAVDLVAKLEPEHRYIYAGAVGYISFRGVLDTAIAIRTIMVHKETVYMQAGAGITFDSDPTFEYDETVNKLMGVVRAVSCACEMKKAVIISNMAGGSETYSSGEKRAAPDPLSVEGRPEKKTKLNIL